jgi:hypothetical protein
MDSDHPPVVMTSRPAQLVTSSTDFINPSLLSVLVLGSSLGPTNDVDFSTSVALPSCSDEALTSCNPTLILFVFAMANARSLRTSFVAVSLALLTLGHGSQEMRPASTPTTPSFLCAMSSS